MVTAMSSDKDPDQDIEQVLEAHFEAEAEDLKAPEGLWGRLESRLSDGLGSGGAPSVWRSLVRRGRWGMAPAFAAVVALVVVVSVAWLATASSAQDDTVLGLALGRGDSSAAASTAPAATAAPRPSRFASSASATPAPMPTAVPSAATGPAGAAGSPGSTGSRGPSVGSTGGFTIVADDGGENFVFLQPQSVPAQDDTDLAPLALPHLSEASPDSRGQLETVPRQVISQGSVSLDV